MTNQERNQPDWLADRFEENRTHLRSVAYRMLGSANDADDAVQESWLRLSRADTSAVENLSGWLTTVVARVCLDMLRARKSHPEESLGTPEHDSIASRADGVDPEHEAVLADSVGLALLVVLETLAPAERLAFVLHDMFAVPFDEIAPIVGRSPSAAKMLASRARRRVQDASPDAEQQPAPQRAIVEAFLSASRNGDFAALLALLDPDVVLRTDPAAAAVGAASARGATAVAEQFSGRARAAQLALIDGAAGWVWAPGGTPRTVFSFRLAHGKIVDIEILADTTRLGQLDVVILGD
jgi:RNA polymerase sigma-70 factor (ECF subfamily)